MNMKLAIGLSTTFLVLCAGIFLSFTPRVVLVGPIQPGGEASAPGKTTSASQNPTASMPATPESQSSTPSAGGQKNVSAVNDRDIPPQQQLANPPAIAKGIYLTGWSAGSSVKMQSVINLIKRTELNAVVVDIKDYSGYVSYATAIPEVKASGAENEIRIARPNTLIKELHDNGIYVIGRITDFQDPILAKAHPEWALKNKTTGGVWKDNHGLSWIDPAAKPAWEYFAAITRDAFSRGFDEIQFDYIRFASDGALENIEYPYWDGKTPKATIIARYFKFLRDQFPSQKISADLFGLATVNSDDLGIGQVIQSAYQYFDYVSPMVYPSHYASGFLGYKSPAKYPYEVINYSMSHAVQKLIDMGNSNSTPQAAMASSTASSSVPKIPYSPFNLGYIPNSKLRPWLQDFDLSGVPYTASMVKAQKQAVYDTLNTTSTNKYYGGWLLWDAANTYTEAALDPE